MSATKGCEDLPPAPRGRLFAASVSCHNLIVSRGIPLEGGGTSEASDVVPRGHCLWRRSPSVRYPVGGCGSAAPERFRASAANEETPSGE